MIEQKTMGREPSLAGHGYYSCTNRRELEQTWYIGFLSVFCFVGFLLVFPSCFGECIYKYIYVFERSRLKLVIRIHGCCWWMLRSEKHKRNKRRPLFSLHRSRSSESKPTARKYPRTDGSPSHMYDTHDLGKCVPGGICLTPALSCAQGGREGSARCGSLHNVSQNGNRLDLS